MTSDAMLGWLIIGGLIVVSLLFGRKKSPQKPPGMVFVEVVEIFEVRKRPKKSGFLVNLAIVATIIAFFWLVSR